MLGLKFDKDKFTKTKKGKNDKHKIQCKGDKKMPLPTMGMMGMLNGVMGATMCKAGKHIGEFQQKPDKPKCYYHKICPICNELVEKYEHEYDDWACEDSQSNKLTRKCKHCGYKEYKEVQG